MLAPDRQPRRITRREMLKLTGVLVTSAALSACGPALPTQNAVVKGAPTGEPAKVPTKEPTKVPTAEPTKVPTLVPTPAVDAAGRTGLPWLSGYLETWDVHAPSVYDHYLQERIQWLKAGFDQHLAPSGATVELALYPRSKEDEPEYRGSDFTTDPTSLEVALAIRDPGNSALEPGMLVTFSPVDNRLIPMRPSSVDASGRPVVTIYSWRHRTFVQKRRGMSLAEKGAVAAWLDLSNGQWKDLPRTEEFPVGMRALSIDEIYRGSGITSAQISPYRPDDIVCQLTYPDGNEMVAKRAVRKTILRALADLLALSYEELVRQIDSGDLQQVAIQYPVVVPPTVRQISMQPVLVNLLGPFDVDFSVYKGAMPPPKTISDTSATYSVGPKYIELPDGSILTGLRLFFSESYLVQASTGNGAAAAGILCWGLAFLRYWQQAQEAGDIDNLNTERLFDYGNRICYDLVRLEPAPTYLVPYFRVDKL